MYSTVDLEGYAQSSRVVGIGRGQGRPFSRWRVLCAGNRSCRRKHQEARCGAAKQL